MPRSGHKKQFDNFLIAGKPIKEAEKEKQMEWEEVEKIGSSPCKET